MAGYVVFADLSMTRAGSDKVLLFTSDGLAASTSGVFSVAAATLAGLTLTTIGNGTTTQQVIVLQDAIGNTVAQCGVAVTAPSVDAACLRTPHTLPPPNVLGLIRPATLALPPIHI